MLEAWLIWQRDVSDLSPYPLEQLKDSKAPISTGNRDPIPIVHSPRQQH